MFIRYAAGTAVAIAAPMASADAFTLQASGTFDFRFNTFDSPLDGIEVGDAWDLKVSYDTNIPGSGTAFFQSFKDALCALELVVDGNSYELADFASGECDIIVTQNPCPCGDVGDIQFDFILPEGIGFRLFISDDQGGALPLMSLPTTGDDLTDLLDNVQFEFFAPIGGGSTARALSTSADSLNVIAGKIPAPGAAGMLALAGLAATRRRR